MSSVRDVRPEEAESGWTVLSRFWAAAPLAKRLLLLLSMRSV